MVTERKAKYKTGKEIVAEIKEGFKECGRSPKEEYTFEFHLYFKSAKQAKCAEPAVKKLGPKTDMASAGKKHACVGYALMVANYKKFEKWGQACVKIAEEHGGEFDGWQLGPPEGAEPELDPSLLDAEGNLDFSKLLGEAGLVIGSQAEDNPYKHEVTITIPGAIEPIDRGELYEDPLIAGLKKHKKLGVVLGGQSELQSKPKGGVKITAATIRLGTNKPDELVEFLKAWIKKYKYPSKTKINTL